MDKVAVSVNSYVYEAIQRKYRNAVVKQIRTTLKARYGDDWEEQVKRPFKAELDTIKRKADLYRETGEISSPIMDTLDYLGVNHFHNLFDLHFDIIFANQKFPKDISNEPKNAILRWSKAIRNIRDPISHPAEIDLSILDAIHVVDSARRIVQIFDKKTTAEIQGICRTIINMERGDSEPVRVLDDNLPPAESIVTDFIGRTDELEELYQWFQDPTQKRWLLAGAGGKGKTAIAYRFAVQVKNSAPKPYTIVLWLSAKRRKFMEGAIVAIDHPDFTDLDSAINKVLIDYGWKESIDKPLREKVDITLNLLNQFPTLLIVDDIDTLESEDDEAVAFFTFEVPHTKSKVLYTSRSKFPGMSKSTTLVNGFNLADTAKYIDTLMGKYIIQETPLSEGKIEEIRAVTEGSPLYIEELLRLHAMGVALDECIGDWKEKGELAREFSLRREFELLTDAAQKVLLACCINRQASAISDLEAVTRLSRDKVLKAIDELARLFLVPRPYVIEGVPRFDVNPNTRFLVIDVMSAYGVFGDIESAFRSLRGEIISSGKRRADVKAYLRQVVASMKSDRQYEAEKLLLDKALVEYPNDPDLLGQLGWIYFHWQPRPKIEEARRCFERAARLNCKTESMYWQWWRMEADKLNWAMAVKAAEKGLKNCPNSIELQYCLGYSYSRFGKALEMQFQYSRAQDEFNRAEKILESALKSTENIPVVGYKLRSQIYRSLILTYEALLKYIDEKTEKKKENILKSKMIKTIKDWSIKHPEDDYMTFEAQRLAASYPELASVL